METILKAYIYEAIEVEKAGLNVNFKKTTELIIPEEFQNKLDKIPVTDLPSCLSRRFTFFVSRCFFQAR